MLLLNATVSTKDSAKLLAYILSHNLKFRVVQLTRSNRTIEFCCLEPDVFFSRKVSMLAGCSSIVSNEVARDYINRSCSHIIFSVHRFI